MRSKVSAIIGFSIFSFKYGFIKRCLYFGNDVSKKTIGAYVFIAIITSVLIFYFNDFSAALGKTDKLPILISVWMPIVIIFIFSGVGLIHANQK